jgi:hypothetical protein
MASLYSLPVELLESILVELSLPDLAMAKNVCHTWRELCDHSSAIPIARRKLVELRTVARANKSLALVAKRIQPFVVKDYNRKEYISRVGTDLPDEFKIWVLETPIIDMIGWHCFALRDDHNRQRYEELGIDWTDAMVFSRSLKPGYTLLPTAKVMEVEDPDYSPFNNTDLTNYPGSWQCRRPTREHKVKALQVWADLSTYTPKVTLLLLSGSDRWDGTVWLTETRAPYRHSVESMTQDTQLVWIRPMGSWTDYLKSECKLLRDNYLIMPKYEIFRSGPRVWQRQVY